MSETIGYPSYCDQKNSKGLTCQSEDLELVKKLVNSHDDYYENTEAIYKCRVCNGLYKYCRISKNETRNFDCDPGWWTMLDQYFKIEEIYAGESKFTIAEARLYGYTGEDFTFKDNRCNFEQTPSGLTCRAGKIKFLSFASPDKTDTYDPRIFKCQRCGQLYKEIWHEKNRLEFIKVSDSDF